MDEDCDPSHDTIMAALSKRDLTDFFRLLRCTKDHVRRVFALCAANDRVQDDDEFKRIANEFVDTAIECFDPTTGEIETRLAFECFVARAADDDVLVVLDALNRADRLKPYYTDLDPQNPALFELVRAKEVFELVMSQKWFDTSRDVLARARKFGVDTHPIYVNFLEVENDLSDANMRVRDFVERNTRAVLGADAIDMKELDDLLEVACLPRNENRGRSKLAVEAATLAIERGDSELVGFLLAANHGLPRVNVDAIQEPRLAVVAARKSSDPEIVLAFVRAETSPRLPGATTPFHAVFDNPMAASLKWFDRVRDVMQKYVDVVDERGRTPRRYAAECGFDPKTVDEFFES
jgi:hypothetical protein